MKKIFQTGRNEDGFILVLGMSILVVLTLLGISAIRNSVIDLKIAGNERSIAQKFYVADSAWQVGGLWINNRSSAPPIVNVAAAAASTGQLTGDASYMRNYGDGADGVINDAFSTGTQDGTYMGTRFWYRITYNGDKSAVKFGTNYRDFNMGIQTSADATVAVATRMYKVYKVGY